MKSIFIILTFSFLISSEIKEQTINAIESFYNDDIEIINKTFKISKKIKSKIQNEVKQKFFRDQIYYWTIKKDGINKGYALLDNSKGKSMPITFLAIFNSNKEIENVSIIKYREPYGGEIRNSNWLKQFINYSDSSNYKIGKGIDNISGATISVKSVSKGIHKLSLIINYIITYFNGN